MDSLDIGFEFFSFMRCYMHLLSPYTSFSSLVLFSKAQKHRKIRKTHVR